MSAVDTVNRGLAMRSLTLELKAETDDEAKERLYHRQGELLTAAETEAAASAAECGRLQAECGRLQARSAGLQRERDELASGVSQHLTELQESHQQQLRDLRGLLELLGVRGNVGQEVVELRRQLGAAKGELDRARAKASRAAPEPREGANGGGEPGAGSSGFAPESAATGFADGGGEGEGESDREAAFTDQLTAVLRQLEKSNDRLYAENDAHTDRIEELEQQLKGASGVSFAELRAAQQAAAEAAAQRDQLSATVVKLSARLEEISSAEADKEDEEDEAEAEAESAAARAPGADDETAAVFDMMERRLRSLAALVREKDAEIAILRATVERECGERTQLLATMGQLRQRSSAAAAPSEQPAQTELSEDEHRAAVRERQRQYALDEALAKQAEIPTTRGEEQGWRPHAPGGDQRRAARRGGNTKFR